MATIATLMVDVLANTASIQKDVDAVNTKLESITGVAGKVGAALVGAFTVGAIVSAGKQVIDFASHTTDLAAKLGMSTTAVQKFDLAFSPAGISIDMVAKASQTLSKNLIEGDKSTVAGLGKLGLSAATLKTLAPEKQFLAVADAVGQIQNPTEKTYAAMTIFGKGGAELLAGLTGHLEETTEEFERLGLIIDEETIAAADEFGDQMGVVSKQLMAVMATALAPLLPMLSKAADAFMVIGKYVGQTFTLVLQSLVVSMQFVIAKVSNFFAEFFKLGSHLPFVGDQFKNMAELFTFSAVDIKVAFDDVAVSTSSVGASAMAATAPVVGLGKAAEEAADKAAKAAEKQRKEFEKLQADLIKMETDRKVVSLEQFGEIAVANSQMNQTIMKAELERIRTVTEAEDVGATTTVQEIERVAAADEAAVKTRVERHDTMKDRLIEGMETLRQATIGAFGRMLIGAKDFSDGLEGMWEATKAHLLTIFDQIAGAFIEDMLGRMIAAAGGARIATALGLGGRAAAPAAVGATGGAAGITAGTVLGAVGSVVAPIAATYAIVKLITGLFKHKPVPLTEEGLRAEFTRQVFGLTSLEMMEKYQSSPDYFWVAKQIGPISATTSDVFGETLARILRLQPELNNPNFFQNDQQRQIWADWLATYLAYQDSYNAFLALPIAGRVAALGPDYVLKDGQAWRKADLLATGGAGWVTNPTQFIAGEGGEPEFVSVTPRSKMRTGGLTGDLSTFHSELVGLRSDLRRAMAMLPKALKVAVQQAI